MGKILATELIKRFKTTYTKPPDWAWPLKPSIPLVGQTYKPGKGLLIYASAENLTGLNRPVNKEERYFGKAAWNRYRFRYEDKGRHPEDDFFPDVGIEPMTNGGLFAAGLFIAEKLNLEKREKPRLFLEIIAVSNWCKFSIKAKNNIDYLRNTKSNTEKLTVSLPYVVSELTLLQPKVTLVPKQVWDRPKLREEMKSASPSTLFLPVPQFGHWPLNKQLKEYDCPAKHLKEQLKDTLCANWMEKLRPIRGVKKDDAWRYIAKIDELLSRLDY